MILLKIFEVSNVRREKKIPFLFTIFSYYFSVYPADLSPVEIEYVIFKDFEGADDEFCVSVFDANGQEIVSYKPIKQQELPLPDPAVPAKLPKEIESMDIIKKI